MNYNVPVNEAVSVGDAISPFSNDIAFLASPSIVSRSIFTDRGPVSKPPVILQQGGGASITSPTRVTLVGSVLSATMVGLRLFLGGSASNNGDYLIVSVPSSTQVIVQANFTTPEVANGALSWSVVSPRDGVIADSPLDVSVRVNGSPVLPQKVAGLMGQIVLPFTPDPSDDVKVDYFCVRDPTVEFRRLNSPEFTLNGGSPRVNRLTQHSYAYKCVLIRPSDYIPAVDPQAGTGPVFTSATQVTLPGANLDASYVGLYLRVTGLGARTYRIVTVLSSTECVVSPT